MGRDLLRLIPVDNRFAIPLLPVYWFGKIRNLDIAIRPTRRIGIVHRLQKENLTVEAAINHGVETDGMDFLVFSF